jgi:acyl carrier protein
MNDQEVLGILHAALREALPDRASEVEALNLDLELRDLGISSVVAMEIIGFVEDAIGRTFRREELAGVRRLSDIARLIKQRADFARSGRGPA